MTPAPTIHGRAMRHAGGDQDVWYLALSTGVMLTVYRMTGRWWRPWRGSLTRKGDVHHVRAWTAQWAATKLARRLGRAGIPQRKDRGRLREGSPR